MYLDICERSSGKEDTASEEGGASSTSDWYGVALEKLHWPLVLMHALHLYLVWCVMSAV